jgi:diguanylate cyclase (GGDEF)-like protein
MPDPRNEKENPVKRNYPILLAGDRLPGNDLRGRKGVRKNVGGTHSLGREPRHKIVSMVCPKQRESLDAMLSSALLGQDKELAGIVSEVEDLLKTIKAQTPETQAVGIALQRIVLCAVKQSILDRELRSLALTDDLTGLYNRRGFLAVATQQMRLMRRNGAGLLLFFADVDNLKAINDSLGHQEGDFALIRTADALEQTFRDSDMLARLGGDEFAALAVDASGQNEEVILGRLEENLRISCTDESRYQLSLSVGVAKLDPHRPSSIGELLEQADRSMYAEKKKKARIRESERTAFERSFASDCAIRTKGIFKKRL